MTTIITTSSVTIAFLGLMLLLINNAYGQQQQREDLLSFTEEDQTKFKEMLAKAEPYQKDKIEKMISIINDPSTNSIVKYADLIVLAPWSSELPGFPLNKERLINNQLLILDEWINSHDAVPLSKKIYETMSTQLKLLLASAPH
jgi:hypothetical protein